MCFCVCVTEICLGVLNFFDIDKYIGYLGKPEGPVGTLI